MNVCARKMFEMAVGWWVFVVLEDWGRYARRKGGEIEGKLAANFLDNFWRGKNTRERLRNCWLVYERFSADTCVC